MKLLIIADDFTGALDTGVQLSKKSIPTTVIADIDTSQVPLAVSEECEVLVINADLRHANPQKAYEITRLLLKAYAKEGIFVYLKTDSALRGNISAIFAAAHNIMKKPLCFIPAFPDLKRTTRNATAYVDRVLLEHSVFRNDPRTPTLESYIPHIINNSYSQSCVCIPVDNIQALTDQELAYDTVYLFDCETNEQLSSIGNMLEHLNLYELTAGCAGFASTFASHISLRTSPSAQMPSSGPVLFISGSANAVTLNQLRYAKQNNYSVLTLSEAMFSYINNITPEVKDKAFYKDLIFQNMLKQAVSALSAKQSIILATATDSSELFDFKLIKNVLKTDESIHNYIAEYTSCLVESILQAVSITNIAIFGGDMAQAVLKKFHCHQVEARGEVTAGVPLCSVEFNGNLCNLVTKSGGFGSEDIIPVIEQYFIEGKDD